MFYRKAVFASSVLAVLISCTPGVTVHAPVPDATVSSDWPGYNRTLAGDRFSPLSEINRENVAKLQAVCTYALPEVTSMQTGPIVVAGTMYFTTDTISYAIDASNCAEKWKQVRHSTSPSALAVHRGFAYQNGRLFRGTSDAHALAMDTTDGRVIWDRALDVNGEGVSYPMAPIATDGLVFLGNAGGDQVGVTGHVYALDANDGHVVWRFDVVPSTGPARATWTNPRLPISGGAFWTSFTYDAANRVLYVPAGNPAPDFDIEMRTGDNLYSNSVIAIDSKTGRMLGYNQLVKRDTHDWDVDTPPVLVTTRSGRAIVASANKDGLLSILDRSRLTGTGARSGADPAAMLNLLSQTPTTTRTNTEVALSRDTTTTFCPGVQGGSEWNGAAYSPQTNSFYVGTVDWCMRVRLRRDTTTLPTKGIWLGNENKDVLTPVETAKGWLTSFDAENGSIKWKFQTPRPILAAVTPTAGGVAFAADLGGQLYALNANTGQVLWQTSIGQATGGGIITYLSGGHQLLAVASGMKSALWPGAAAQSRVVVYGLPRGM
jgi:alcohol dehydrogenase (cytochrome c)